MSFSTRLRITGFTATWWIGSMLLAAAEVEPRVSEWRAMIQEEVRADADLGSVEITAAKFVKRPLIGGRELRLTCEGAGEKQLQQVRQIAIDILKADPDGSVWLEKNSVVAVSKETNSRSDDGEVDEKKMISQLVQSVQDRVEFNKPFEGVLLSGVEFSKAEAGSGLKMRLTGKVMQDGQKSELEDLVKKLLENSAEWKPYRQQIDVSAAEMKVNRPSSELAARYFPLGLESFWMRDYAAADRAFGLALAEDPANEGYFAWRVLTALAAGDEERARFKLGVLLKANPRGTSSPAIAKQFERVQGPLRRHLSDLEKQVLLGVRPDAKK